MLYFFGWALIPLLVIGVVTAAIVALVRRRPPSGEPGIGTTRRLFLYGLGFVALMFAATGLTFLATGLLEAATAGRDLRSDAAGTAFGLAATIMGFSVWALVWLGAQRTLVAYPGEAGTLGRKLYAYGVLGVSAAVVAVTASFAVRGLLQPSSFEAEVLAPIIVWSAVWAFHWRWEALEGQPSDDARTTRRLYAYVTSTYGLVMLTAGGGTILALFGEAAYDRLFHDRLLGGGTEALWNEQSRTALAVALVGGVWWTWHWHRVSSRDFLSDLRRVVVYIVGIFGGLVTAVAGASALLFALLIWLVDQSRFVSAAEHFRIFPIGLTTVMVGAAVWAYHAALAAAEGHAASRQVTARQSYRYLTAAVGLGTLGVGATLMLGLIVGSLTTSISPIIAGERWWATPLATSITLLVVGTPLWAVPWRRQQAVVELGSPGETDALPRRAFIFGVLGIAVLAALVAFSTFLFQIIEATLEGRLSASVWDDTKWAIGVTLTAAVFGVYHWQVLREDRAAEPVMVSEQPRPTPREVTVVAPAGARALVDAIEERLGIRVAAQVRRDAPLTRELTGPEVDGLVDAIRSAPGERVLVIVGSGGVEVIPL